MNTQTTPSAKTTSRATEDKAMRSLIETAKGYYCHPTNPIFREKFKQALYKWQTISQMSFLSSYRVSLEIARTVYTIRNNL